MSTFTEKFKLPRKIVAWLAAMHFFGDPSKNMKIVGVTGTSGKTTTTTLLYKVAKALGYKAGLVGTVENIIDGKVLPTTFTTPEPRQLYKVLNEMAAAGCEYVFMEVSSHGLDQDRVAGLRFTGGIFTNLSQDHFDYHKNFENYFRAKEKLFTKYLSRESFALSNTDDSYGERILQNTKARKYFYGLEDLTHGHPAPAERKDVFGAKYFFGKLLKANYAGLELAVGGDVIKTRLLGKFNAYNLLAVWSACKLLGFPMGEVAKIMEDIMPPRGRFEHFMAPSGFMVVVDYAHKPDALEKIIAALKEIKNPEGRLITLFGCGGDRDELKRPIMGKIGASMSDLAIFTSDNPRSEDPLKIIEAMQMNLSETEKKKVIIEPDRRKAIEKAVALAEAGDVILCAGKGHETYQEINGVKNHFDDLEELRNALR